ncbi:MAG TPA: PHB depolymerase family esterase [Fluviicola sp.]|nr:PHB depolymerase family esterase [Fluviicola sp.]
MYYYLLSALLFLAAGTSFAQTTVNGSFDHGGITRTYSFYVPASYVAGQPVPLVLNLHGLGTDGEYQAENRDFRPIADTANFIVVHPDGSVEPNINQRFWNYGNVNGSTVDDIGFLEALIDTISAHYSINPARIYSAGMSNGSFMCYYLACQSDRFAAVGAVTGSMSIDMYDNCTPSRPTPAIHIHGTSDPINPYNGNGTMKAIEEVTAYWVDQNNCNTTPAITPVPDIDPDDDATAERYLYSGGVYNHTVELFKVTGGGHTWPGHYVFTLSGNTCMDFDASKELWRFFSQYELAPASTESQISAELLLWPNPSEGMIHFGNGNQPITEIIITDMLGKMVEERSGFYIDQVDLGHLKAGNYLARISGDGFYVVRKMVKL